MKDSNRDTIIHFEASSNEYAPVKAAISEELEAVISLKLDMRIRLR